MSAPRTRRRAAQEKLEHGSDDDRSTAVVDGNGSTRDAPEASDSDGDENIFLFWPNIIGTRPNLTMRPHMEEKSREHC